MSAVSTTRSIMFHDRVGWTVVPRPWPTDTSPFSSSRLTDSRRTVRLTPNCLASGTSGGSVSPGATCPVTMTFTSASTTATPRRWAGIRSSMDGMRGPPGVNHVRSICGYGGCVDM